MTAGATQEAIDPVRYITNHSTGKMGYALARDCMLRGANVTLVSGQSALTPPPFTTVISVTSAKEMFDAVTEHAESQDIIIKAAAVADYRPASIATEKMKKKEDALTIELERTDDILKYLGEHKHQQQFLCGFSMETEHMLENSRKKLEKKHLDMIVANNLKQAGAGFGTDTNVVTMITPQEEIALELMSKEEAAHAIVSQIFKKSQLAVNLFFASCIYAYNTFFVAEKAEEVLRNMGLFSEMFMKEVIVMRIEKEQTVAIGIDYQEKLVPVMHKKEKLIENSRILLSGLSTLEVPICLTQQYTKGLGETVPEIIASAGIKEHVEKISFSAYEDIKEFVKGKRFVILCGIEAHICVLQTVIDLIENGHVPILVVDCISSRKAYDRKIALKRAEKEGAFLTTYEAVLFELLKEAGTEQSKQIQRLIK